MPAEPADRPTPDPDEIAGRSFTKVRKGYEVDEVRAYLVAVASQVRESGQRLADAERRLAELERRGTDPRDLDESALTQLLGEETARVLETARQAATDIRARATQEAEAATASATADAASTREAADAYAQGVRADADAYAAEVRSTADAEVAALRERTTAETDAARSAAETVLAERTAEAEAAAAEIRAEADAYASGVRSEADTYDAETRTAADIYASNTREEAEGAAAEVRTDADAYATEVRAAADAARADAEAAAAARLAASDVEVEAILDAAREQGRAMVEEARAYRERVIADLADRRRVARTQLEQVAASRDALAVTLTDVMGRIEASHRALAETEVDARGIGDVAADRAALAEPDPETGATAEAAEPDTEPDTDTDTEPEPDTEAEPEAEAEPEPAVEPDAEPEPEAAVEPEPEPAVEPEPDPEPEAAVEPQVEEPEPEPPAAAEPAGAPDPVEAVFAQLKAQRAGEATTDDGDREPEAPADTSGSEGGPPSDADADLLDRRDAATDELERQLARRLKRVLSDEQNEALDRLRRAKGQPSADEVLLGQGEHLGRYHAAALEDLVAAERAGAGFFGPAPKASADVGDVAGEFAAELVRQLRGRLEAAFDDGGDEQEISDRIRSCYREWKTQRIADTAAHYVLVAFNRGVAGAAADGSSARWLVDDGGVPCPDCDDNALAGAVAKGEEFPTGDLHPPAHPGCRCLAVPA